ncbi:MAG: sugar phosphate nucleotidyltransferase [Bacteroidales bacterium]
MEHTYAVIMAGGGGTRLWPVSRKINPSSCSLCWAKKLFCRVLLRAFATYSRLNGS